MKAKITLEPGQHRDMEVVFLTFEKNFALIGAVKKLGNTRWSQTIGKWYIPKQEFKLEEVFESLKEVFYVDYSTLKKPPPPPPAPASFKKNTIKNISGYLTEKVIKEIELFQIWMQQKRYSANTIKTYTDGLRTFFCFYPDIPISEINNDHLIKFNYEYIIRKKLSASYQNQIVNGIKLFYSRFYKINLDIKSIERPRRAR